MTMPEVPPLWSYTTDKAEHRFVRPDGVFVPLADLSSHRIEITRVSYLWDATVTFTHVVVQDGD
jgi:hypothetical protein